MPAGIPTDALREILKERNVTIVAPENLRAGASWAEQLLEVLERVDFVIGLLPTVPPSASVMFDLGHASALGKRIVLFATPGSERLPATMADILTIRADLDNREALGFAIDQLLNAPEVSKQRNTKRSKRPRALGSLVDDFVQRLTALQSELELEDLVHDILRASGVDAVVQPRFKSGRRPDFAMWSDALASYVGNPLIAEVKRSLTMSQSGELLRRVQAYVDEAGSLWGLLVYADGPSPGSLDQTATPRVLAVKLSELLDQMRTYSFIDVVRMLRNERVHGTGP